MVAAPVTIVGSYLSPYVRKVLVCLDAKGLDYRIDPIVPFFGNDAFSELSPVRRIPVLIDDRVTLCDSSVICEYLEDRYPGPPLRPSTPEARARARWLEEYADTRMGEVFIWRLCGAKRSIGWISLEEFSIDTEGGAIGVIWPAPSARSSTARGEDRCPSEAGCVDPSVHDDRTAQSTAPCSERPSKPASGKPSEADWTRWFGFELGISG